MYPPLTVCYLWLPPCPLCVSPTHCLLPLAASLSPLCIPHSLSATSGCLPVPSVYPPLTVCYLWLPPCPLCVSPTHCLLPLTASLSPLCIPHSLSATSGCLPVPSVYPPLTVCYLWLPPCPLCVSPTHCLLPLAASLSPLCIPHSLSATSGCLPVPSVYPPLTVCYLWLPPCPLCVSPTHCLLPLAASLSPLCIPHSLSATSGCLPVPSVYPPLTVCYLWLPPCPLCVSPTHCLLPLAASLSPLCIPHSLSATSGCLPVPSVYPPLTVCYLWLPPCPLCVSPTHCLLPLAASLSPLCIPHSLSATSDCLPVPSVYPPLTVCYLWLPPCPLCVSPTHCLLPLAASPVPSVYQVRRNQY